MINCGNIYIIMEKDRKFNSVKSEPDSSDSQVIKKTGEEIDIQPNMGYYDPVTGKECKYGDVSNVIHVIWPDSKEN